VNVCRIFRLRSRSIFPVLFFAALLLTLAWSAIAIIPNGTEAKRAWASQTAKTKPQAVKARPSRGSDFNLEAVRLNNLGVAYMNQQRFDQALKNFDRAVALDPKLTVAQLNRGIALLYKQELKSALKAITEATEKLPEDPHGWYSLGLVYKNQGQTEQAIDAFQRAARLGPNDADTQYLLGLEFAQAHKFDEAITAFQHALALNPYHVSAEFGIAHAYQRKGDTASAREHLARFQKLTEQKLGAPMSLNYGDQGPYSLAEQIVPPAAEAPPAIPVRFVPVTETSGLVSEVGKAGQVGQALRGISSASTGVCIFDYDNDGRPDVLVISGAVHSSGVLFHNLGGGRFEDVTRAAKLDVPGPALGCVAGDYDNDGYADVAVALADGIRLFHNEHKGTFRDVTESSGIRRDPRPVSVNFVDYDHDGDLDLFIVRGEALAVDLASSADATSTQLRVVLWRNNGNGTFTDWSSQSGLATIGPATAIIATDFNNDRAVDLIVTGNHGAPLILLNQREGPFKTTLAWDQAKENLPPAVGVVAFDFNKDGWMDLAFTHDGAPGLTLWRNVGGKRLERVPLPDFGWQRGRGLATLDYDNDGLLDLAAVGESKTGGEIRLLRNRGGTGFADATRDAALEHLPLAHPQAVVTADFTGTGSADLLISQVGGPPALLRNQGGNKNSWVRLNLKALADNRSAIGTKVEVFAGLGYQKWEVAAAAGYLGQSSTEILAGLGNAREAEIVRLLWPTGVPQDEIQIAARSVHELTELDRRGSSCPVLWVWNGRSYEFISDMIGPGIVGHWVGPGERNVPDPTEYLKVDGSRVRLRDGKLSFRIAEPMEEVVFIDQVRLLAVDHPLNLDVYPNERFLSAPPFPEFKVIASRGAHPPRGAWDDRGHDILRQLVARDHRYVTSFDLAPFRGFAKMHSIELDLGDWNPTAPLRLLMHGLTDYFTATSMFAAYQAGVEAVAPYVEAQDSAGHWLRVIDDMGFPAGLARTMVADLSGRVPAGTHRIRITTNLVLYWDQILVDNTPDNQPVRITEAALESARLEYLGYPKETRVSIPEDILYEHQSVSATGPFVHQAGSYTRYGDVRELLTGVDDKFVILSSGDQVALEFDPSTLPPLPSGWSRDYFFFLDGFEKDRDFYAAYGDSVEPLPYHRMKMYPYPEDAPPYPTDAAYLDYLLSYNTRLLSDSTPSYRYRYPKTSRRKDSPPAAPHAITRPREYSHQ